VPVRQDDRRAVRATSDRMMSPSQVWRMFTLLTLTPVTVFGFPETTTVLVAPVVLLSGIGFGTSVEG
jgi:hypothetical protein